MHICSDTCIWVDFQTINALELPFKLGCKYYMSSDALDEELLSPPGIKEELLRLGLIAFEIGDEELSLVYDYGTKYRRLSAKDRIALAIAKQNGYMLLTGDKQLRLAAEIEGVVVRGTLWILDEILKGALISKDTYRRCINDLKRFNGQKIRLPDAELRKRLEELDNLTSG